MKVKEITTAEEVAMIDRNLKQMAKTLLDLDSAYCLATTGLPLYIRDEDAKDEALQSQYDALLERLENMDAEAHELYDLWVLRKMNQGYQYHPTTMEGLFHDHLMPFAVLSGEAKARWQFMMNARDIILATRDFLIE